MLEFLNAGEKEGEILYQDLDTCLQFANENNTFATQLKKQTIRNK